ncbi:hypothetical protein B0I35DRAFT_470608 [Stachybotrys elegans]|uniref:Amine oxidase domain-containing protein n=1 Tax=Stachybotrys elegans TaxID=80388 RepID=A0A8K0SKU6_9HYPO|nr:hypothetical protein B0I35DRAFT_470608 [Stachybotrys elegans]
MHLSQLLVITGFAHLVAEELRRDVCIVGGGASGTHAAVSLIDQNKTVIVIDREDRLGGNTHTWTDPHTGRLVDIGVVVFQPKQVVFDFFSKFDLPLLNLSSIQWNEPGQPANISQPAAIYNTLRIDTDFRDGSNVTRTAWPDVGAALGRMAEALAQYDYVLEGYELPDPVPEDLYMPFGAFVDKYNFSDAFPLVYQVSQGMGDLLHVPTIFAIKYFNLGDLQALSQGYLTHARGNNSDIYAKAGEFIGSENILFRSSVVATNRKNTTDGRLEFLISTRDEGLKLLSCKQAVLAVPPHLANLRGWDLTDEEHGVFSQYITSNGYWTGLVKGVGMNQTVSHYNAAGETPYNIPVLPALYALAPVGTIDDVWWIKFGANNPTLTDGQVQDYVVRQIQTLQRAVNAPVTEPEWLIFQSHTPFHLQASPQAIKNGFFRDLTALQGGLGGKMFYTGAAFHTHYSTYLWQYNRDVLIPKMSR